MRPPQDENKKEIISNAKCILQKVQYFISNNDITEATSLETVLQNVNVNLNEYTEALKFLRREQISFSNVILKMYSLMLVMLTYYPYRGETWISN